MTKSLPNFPELSGSKMTKYITKHYVNTVLSMKHSRIALLTWLISECGPDNSFIYSTHLLKKYSLTIIEANKEYNPGKTEVLSHTISLIRNDFRHLLSNGYILPTHNKKTFIVNPMLSYNLKYAKQAREFGRVYQSFREKADIKDARELSLYYLETIGK